MDQYKYFSYLKTRTKLGYFYRKFFLYPKINQFTKGEILDVGCGIGDYLSLTPNSTGIDINEFNIKYVTDIGLKAFLLKDEIFPFNADSFNSVVLDNVIEHLTSPKSLLSEIKRVLKKDGNLIIGIPGIKGYSSDDDHKNFYTLETLKNLMEKFGFAQISFFHTPLNFIFFSKYISRFATYSIFKNTE